MATPSVTISAPVSETLQAQIKQAAREDHRTVAAWVRDTLTRAIAERPQPEPEPLDPELIELLG